MIKIIFAVLYVFSTMLSLVDVHHHSEYDEGNRRRQENYAGSASYDGLGTYDRNNGYSGSGRYDEFDGSRNTGYGTSGSYGHHEGRVKVKGIAVPERVVEGGERQIHTAVEEGVETVLSKVGFGDERKTERYAKMAADEAVKLAEGQLREKPKSKEGTNHFNQMEGYERGFNSQNLPNEGSYSHGYSSKSYGENYGTNYGGYRNSDLGTGSYGGSNAGYGYKGSRRDEGFGGGMNENRARQYENEGRRDEYGGHRDQYGYQENGYGGEYSRGESQREYRTDETY